MIKEIIMSKSKKLATDNVPISKRWEDGAIRVTKRSGSKPSQSKKKGKCGGSIISFSIFTGKIQKVLINDTIYVNIKSSKQGTLAKNLDN